MVVSWNDDERRGDVDIATRAKLGGLANSARNAPREYTAAAHARSDVEEPERTRRAEAMRKLHYTQMGIKSGQARRERR